jgi:hypothetical protein
MDAGQSDPKKILWPTVVRRAGKLAMCAGHITRTEKVMFQQKLAYVPLKPFAIPPAIGTSNFSCW